MGKSKASQMRFYECDLNSYICKKGLIYIWDVESQQNVSTEMVKLLKEIKQELSAFQFIRQQRMLTLR